MTIDSVPTCPICLWDLNPTDTPSNDQAVFCKNQTVQHVFHRNCAEIYANGIFNTPKAPCPLCRNYNLVNINTSYSYVGFVLGGSYTIGSSQNYTKYTIPFVFQYIQGEKKPKRLSLNRVSVPTENDLIKLIHDRNETRLYNTPNAPHICKTEVHLHTASGELVKILTIKEKNRRTLRGHVTNPIHTLAILVAVGIVAAIANRILKV